MTSTSPRAVEILRLTEPEEVLKAVPGTSQRIVPIGPGPFEFSATTFRFSPPALQVGRCTPFLGFAAVSPGVAVLQLPLANSDTLVLNGVEAQPRMFGTYGSGAELLRVNSRDTHYAMLALPDRETKALLELPARATLFRPGSHAYAMASPTAWNRMVRVIEMAEQSTAENPDFFEADQPRRALRDAVLHAARGLIMSAAGEEEPVRIPRASRERRRIVIAADEYLRAYLDRPIYTDDLCDALGVSATALMVAFRSVFQVSPHRFLKLRRLQMVRAALRASDGPAPLVKAVALSHGFWHLGEFAQDYRAAFGETPTETLARAKASTA